jgi:hypothetical protein
MPDKCDGPQPVVAGSRPNNDFATATVPRPGARGRRKHLLVRLREADGPHYDTLCAEVAEAFPARTRWWASVQAVRAVRELLWDELATVDADGAIWLLPAGWQAAGATG